MASKCHWVWPCIFFSDATSLVQSKLGFLKPYSSFKSPLPSNHLAILTVKMQSWSVKFCAAYFPHFLPKMEIQAEEVKLGHFRKVWGVEKDIKWTYLAKIFFSLLSQDKHMNEYSFPMIWSNVKLSSSVHKMALTIKSIFKLFSHCKMCIIPDLVFSSFYIFMRISVTLQ